MSTEKAPKTKKPTTEAVDETSVELDEALFEKYCSAEVTPESCHAFLKEHGIGKVHENALHHVFNPDDPQLTYRLLAAAVLVIRATKKKTFLERHAKAVYDVYDEIAEALCERVQSVTKAGLRKFAQEKGAQMVSSKAIDIVYNKAQPIDTMAKWRAAVLLHAEKTITESKTLTPVFAETACKLFDCFKDVYEVDVLDEQDEDPDDPSEAAMDMQTDE